MNKTNPTIIPADGKGINVPSKLMYDELVEELRHYFDDVPLVLQAADAIEELQGKAKILERIADKWCDAVPKWIPVTEQCPEKSGDYLVFDDCRNLYVNEWHYLLKKWQHDDSRITHWQPLPEPPKEE